MGGLRSTVITAFTISLSCFIFFLLPSISGPAAFAFFLLANSSFLFGFFLSFDAAVPMSARLATTYLALAAMAHLWAGAVATEPAAGLAAMLLFQGLTVGPVTTLVNANWGDDTTVKLIGVTVIIISLLAISGTVAIARRRGFGYWIWFGIVAISMIAGVLSVGLASLYHDEWGPPIWWSLFLPLTYAIAYWFARQNVELKEAPKPLEPPS